MRPTDVLMNEHRVIEQVLGCLERIADRCTFLGELDAESARQALDFFRNFADRCHHGKEERQLFPLLEARGVPRDGGPTGVMLAEHDEGRRLLAEMAEAVEADDPDRFAENARGYAELLRQHILKEDHRLFVLADLVLSDADRQGLLHAFGRVERDEMGAGTHEKYLKLADELALRWGVPRSYREPAAAGCGCACGHSAGR
jgi:hemerythrin-like domain-containing protein